MAVSADVVWAVESGLRGRTRERAMTGLNLARMASFATGRHVSIRRIGEAVEVLTARGLPICSSSTAGYWMAETAEEYEAAVQEARRRALSTLAALRAKRRCLLALRGQGSLKTEHVGAPVARVMTALAQCIEEEK